MASITDRVNVGVGVIVMNSEGEYLLSERISDKHGKGEWSFPGGKPDPGENPAYAAVRELFEETGLVPYGFEAVADWTYDAYPESGVHFVTIYFQVITDETPQDREPEKHGPWTWFDRDTLAIMHDEGKLFSGVGTVLGL